MAGLNYLHSLGKTTKDVHLLLSKSHGCLPKDEESVTSES